MGVFAYDVDVDRINFKITSLVKLKCSVVDPLWCGAALVITTSLISRLLDKLWQGNVTLTISLSVLCIHISEHIKKHAPYFRTTMPVHIGHVLLQILLPRSGLKIFSGRGGAPIWIISNTFGTVWDVTDVVMLDDLVRALVDKWNSLEPRLLRKLVQGMPRRVRELHQRRGGYTRYWRPFLKRRWAWWHWFSSG